MLCESCIQEVASGDTNYGFMCDSYGSVCMNIMQIYPVEYQIMFKGGAFCWLLVCLATMVQMAPLVSLVLRDYTTFQRESPNTLQFGAHCLILVLCVVGPLVSSPIKCV